MFADFANFFIEKINNRCRFGNIAKLNKYIWIAKPFRGILSLNDTWHQWQFDFVER